MESFLTDEEKFNCISNFWIQMRDNEIVNLKMNFENYVLEIENNPWNTAGITKRQFIDDQINEALKIIQKKTPILLDEIFKRAILWFSDILSQKRLETEIELLKNCGGEFTEEDFLNMESDVKNSLIGKFWTELSKINWFCETYIIMAHREYIEFLKDPEAKQIPKNNLSIKQRVLLLQTLIDQLKFPSPQSLNWANEKYYDLFSPLLGISRQNLKTYFTYTYQNSNHRADTPENIKAVNNLLKELGMKEIENK